MAAAVFISCSNNDIEQIITLPSDEMPTDGVGIRFTARCVTDAPENRSHLDMGNSWVWDEGDRIGIHIAAAKPTSNAEARIVSLKEGEPALFRASVNAFAQNDKLYAYYPRMGGTNAEPGAITLTIPHTQPRTQTTAGMLDGRCYPLVCAYELPVGSGVDAEIKETLTLDFRPVAALVKFDIHTADEALREEKIRTVTFTSNSEKAIAGSFTYDLTQVSATSMPEIQRPTEGYTDVSVTLETAAAIPATEGAAFVGATIIPGLYTGDVAVQTDRALYNFAAQEIRAEAGTPHVLSLDLSLASRSEYADVGQVEEALTNAYNDLLSYDNMFPVIGMHNLTTPEAAKGSWDGDGAPLIPFTTMTFTDEAPSSWFHSQCYKTVNAANKALALIRTLPEGHLDRPRYMAEALFLRALMYYRLTQAFGNASYFEQVLNFSSNLSEDPNSPARSDKETIRATYIEQLKQSIPALMTRQQAVAKRAVRVITQNAARALIAKTYLYQKNWALAKEYASQIILSGDNDLTTPFADVFKEKCEFGPESVFEINAELDPNNDIRRTCQLGQIQGARGIGLGWGFNAPKPALIDSFEENDSRKSVTVLAPGDNLEGDIFTIPSHEYQYGNGKCYIYKEERSAKGRTGECGLWYNPRIIRYSDILLVYAEACCELGGDANIDEALAKLEMVRKRARGDNASALPEVKTRDQNELREKIRFERKIELALEYERYFDLVRWGIAKEMIPNFVEGKHELFPIPKDCGLAPNPGY